MYFQRLMSYRFLGIVYLLNCIMTVSTWMTTLHWGYHCSLESLDIISSSAMPLDNPHITTIIGAPFCLASNACSSYLFLQRVRAIYADSPRVRLLFSAFWFILCLSGITMILGSKPTFIPGTHHFRDAGISPILELGIFTAILFDSSVFLAISYKVVSTHALVDDQIQWYSAVSGKALPPLSRAVLRSGQQYYLRVPSNPRLSSWLIYRFSLATCTMVLIGILLYLPSVSQTLKNMLVAIPTPLIASMACRVFRNIKLFDRDVSLPYPVSEIQFL